MIKVKILSMNEKWATIRFLSSASTTRMKTSDLTRDYLSGKLAIKNEEILSPYLEEVD